MGKVIVIGNQKGGVGKTTTANALAAGLAKIGFKVLAIDMDGQANLTSSFGGAKYDVLTTFDILQGTAQPHEAIQQLPCGVDLIGTNTMMAGAEGAIIGTGREYRLKEALEKDGTLEKYHYIILDTPPNLGVLTMNAFTAADEVIFASQAGIFSTEALDEVNNTLNNVRKYLNKNVSVIGILITRYNPRYTTNKAMYELTKMLADYMKTPVYKTFIRDTVTVGDAQAAHVDVLSYAPNSIAAIDHWAFIKEFLEHQGFGIEVINRIPEVAETNTKKLFERISLFGAEKNK